MVKVRHSLGEKVR